MQLNRQAGKKIEISTTSDNVIGIISGKPGVIGNAAPIHWHGSNKTDGFGRELTEDNYSLPMRRITDKHKIKYGFPDSKDKYFIIYDILSDLLGTTAMIEMGLTGPDNIIGVTGLTGVTGPTGVDINGLFAELSVVKPKKVLITSDECDGSKELCPTYTKKRMVICWTFGTDPR